MADLGERIDYTIPTVERAGTATITGSGVVIEVLADGRYVTQEDDGALRAVPPDAVT